MLSRALAPRLAAAARRSRPVASPAFRALPVLSARTFAAKGKGSSSSSTPKDSGAQKASKPEAEAGAKKDAAASSEPETSAEPKEGEQIPFDKLPDLTQGIPSTLMDEMNKQSGKSQQSSSLQAVEEQDESEGRGRGGQRDEYVSTSERNRKWWTRFMLMTAASGSVLGLMYMGRDWEDQIEASRHPDIPNGWSPLLWWQRSRARMSESVSYYQDPAFDKLLPDPDPSFERPYTLCLSLDDLLVHSEWSREHGWRVAKRPGSDYFIRYLSQYYELVLFTTVPFAMGEPLVRKLDPFRFIMWPLYREATKYEDGEIVKVSRQSLEAQLLLPAMMTCTAMAKNITKGRRIVTVDCTAC